MGRKTFLIAGALGLGAMAAPPGGVGRVAASTARSATISAQSVRQVAVRQSVQDAPFDAAAAIGRLSINEGPYRGGYIVAEMGALKWYFVNIGLMPMVRRDPGRVKAYLDLYLRSLCTNSTGRDVVQDVVFLRPYDPHVFRLPFSLQQSDSDDATAGTFLSLASRYVGTSGDLAWFRQRLPIIKRLAQSNILTQQKDSGLVGARQKGNSIGYLQDNCEVYRGLKDLADLLRSIHDPEAARYTGAASDVARGVLSLFNRRVGAYYANDTFEPIGGRFYPDAVGQVFPQVYGVPQGDARATASLYNLGWAYLNARQPRWPLAMSDTEGGFPWMILGFASVKRGDIFKADTQMRALRAIATDPDPNRRSKAQIHELGWYLRAADWRAGFPY